MEKSKFLNLAIAVGKVISTDIKDRARVVVQLNRFNPYINTVSVYIFLAYVYSF